MGVEKIYILIVIENGDGVTSETNSFLLPLNGRIVEVQVEENTSLREFSRSPEVEQKF